MRCGDCVVLLVLVPLGVAASEHNISPSTPGGLAYAVETAAAGDTIVLSPGRYTGANNRNITLSKPLSIQSAAGETSETTEIDCEHKGRCVNILPQASGSRLERIRLVNGGLPPSQVHQASSRPALSKRSKGRAQVPRNATAKSHDHLRVTASDSGVNVGEMLSKLSPRERTRAVSLWLSLSNAFDVISSLPSELFTHPQLWARAEATKAAHQDFSPMDPSERKEHGHKAHWPGSRKAATTNLSTREEDDEESACAPAPPDTESGCTGITTFSATCGSLTEGSSWRYRAESNCTWIIDPPSTESLLVSFSMLDIETGSYCAYDSLSLFQRSDTSDRTLFATLCGTLSQPECYSCDPEDLDLSSMIVKTPFTIQLISDNEVEEGGFTLSWRKAPQSTGHLSRPPVLGGALAVTGASVTLEAVHLGDGVADFGGGLAMVNASAVISHSSLTGNSAQKGGGLFALRSTIQVHDSRFLRNQARNQTTECSATEGAGLFAESSWVLMRGSVVNENSVEAGCGLEEIHGGGGVFVVDSELQLESSQVDHNNVLITETTQSCYGGGLFSTQSNVSVSFSSISWNTLELRHGGYAASGGGVYLVSGPLIVASSVVSFNLVDNKKGHTGEGGGISVLDATTSLTSSNVSSNSLFGGKHAGGGGVVIAFGGQVRMFACHVSNNSASGEAFAAGGGLSFSRIEDHSHPDQISLLISFTSFISNFVKGEGMALGGGIYFSSSGDVAAILSSQISNNSIDCEYAHGGGLAGDWGGKIVVNSSLMIGNDVRAKYWATGGGMSGFCRLNPVNCTQFEVALSTFALNNLHSFYAGTFSRAHGGGIFTQARCSVHSTTISKNVVFAESLLSRAQGGGILSSGGPLYVVASELSENVCRCYSKRRRYTCYSGGGGISVGDRPLPNRPDFFPPGGYAFINASRMYSNHVGADEATLKVAEAMGAGLFFHGTTAFVLSCSISSNSAFSMLTHGGGLACLACHLNVSWTLVTNNSLVGDVASGGGLWLEAGSTSISSSHVSFNSLHSFKPTSQGMGAGVYSRDLQLNLVASSVNGNSLRVMGFASQIAYGAGLYSFSPNVLSVSACHVGRNWLVTSGLGYGAGMYVEAPSTAFLVQLSDFHGNSLAARTGQGGGVFLRFTLEAGNLTSVVSSSVLCQNSVVGAEVSGGALHVRFEPDDDSTLLLSAVEMTNNSCHGTSNSVGGAFSIRGGTSVVKSSKLFRNMAASGGGVDLSESASVSFFGSVIRRNVATGVGGAVLATGGVSLYFEDVLMEHNLALLADNIFGYGSGFSVIGGNNVTMVASGVMSTFLQGQRSISLAQTSAISTTHPGWAFELATTAGSEIARFHRCVEGQYLVVPSNSQSRRGCRVCPLGAKCNGANTIDAHRAHWGWVDSDGLLTMLRCPPGYCCEDSVCPRLDYCHGERDGPLCSRCKDGFAEVLGGVGCQKESECHHLKWLLPSVVLATGLLMFGLTVFYQRQARQLHAKQQTSSPTTKKGPDGGEVEVLVFFFQMLPLVMSFHTRAATAEFGQLVFSVFSLNISGRQDGGGLCPFKGFTALGKTISGAAIPVLCCLWLLAFSVLHRIMWLHSGPVSLQERTRFAGIIGALFVVLVLGYSTSVQTIFTLLACVDFKGTAVLFIAAEVECFQRWQLALLCVAMPILLSFPAGLALVVKTEARHRMHSIDGCDKSLWLFTAVDVIAAPFDATRLLTHQWEAVLMLQRLVTIAISVFVTHPLWRSWIVVVLVSVMLVIQMWIQPFKRRACNHFMALTLLLIVFISAWEVGFVVYVDVAMDIPNSTRTKFGALGATCVIFPLVVGVGLILWGALHRTPTKLLQTSEKDVELEMLEPGIIECIVCQGVAAGEWKLETEPSSLSAFCSEHSAAIC